jgi:hypothetical protein
MSGTDDQTVKEHRKEILVPMFEYINGSESFYVVGGPSVGKTRLLDFLMREDVQKHYIKERDDGKVCLVRVDMNRLSIRNEAWAFYELLLNSIVMEMSGHEDLADYTQQFKEMDFEVIKEHDLLLAHRYFELAVNILCQVCKLKLWFLLDEFDKSYSNLSPETFSQLRAVRDSNKYFVQYGLFMRDLPERLRPSADPDNEDFYELISRNRLGLGPFSKADTVEIIKKLERRRNFSMTPFQRDCLFEASGGHIGLVQVFLSTLLEDQQLSQKLGNPGWLEWLSQLPLSAEESRKIWRGLSKDEQDGLSAFIKGNYFAIPEPVSILLRTKGLVRKLNNSPCLFSPVFEHYVKSLG